MMEPKTMRGLQEAVDEVERELNVRRRCFGRWVEEGKVSRTDAQDRIDRLATALEALRQCLGGQVESAQASTGRGATMH